MFCGCQQQYLSSIRGQKGHSELIVAGMSILYVLTSFYLHDINWDKYTSQVFKRLHLGAVSFTSETMDEASIYTFLLCLYVDIENSKLFAVQIISRKTLMGTIYKLSVMLSSKSLVKVTILSTKIDSA